ncbi:hypothetical protein [Leifsonia sp. Leaf264]|uniref:hypothetical protein n=1 Tax=Leifsonia sp. Leaf264 TaxID=1736314 RepID=UPI0006F27A0A|nr:hypothetical protein [Leifsonia sp. Leaf264]KQO98277.1 hypothetical protein ASF30_09465 [Leifsonia sp. Leaf264]
MTSVADLSDLDDPIDEIIALFTATPDIAEPTIEQMEELAVQLHSSQGGELEWIDIPEHERRQFRRIAGAVSAAGWGRSPTRIVTTPQARDDLAGSLTSSLLATSTVGASAAPDSIFLAAADEISRLGWGPRSISKAAA